MGAAIVGVKTDNPTANTKVKARKTKNFFIVNISYSASYFVVCFEGNEILLVWFVHLLSKKWGIINATKNIIALLVSDAEKSNEIRAFFSFSLKMYKNLQSDFFKRGLEKQ
jgi:hypothetical protein